MCYFTGEDSYETYRLGDTWRQGFGKGMCRLFGMQGASYGFHCCATAFLGATSSESKSVFRQVLVWWARCSVWSDGFIYLWVFCVAPKCIYSWKGLKWRSPPWGSDTLGARWQALEWNGRITQNMAEIACFQKISIMLWLSADDAFGSKRCAICSYPKELADQRPADKTRLTIVLLERIMV